jgi:CheY-like chemotaxis protein
MAKKPKILCVDDLEENLQIRTLLLQQFGCETLVAHDHTSAIQMTSQEQPDLLLIDYHLANGETGEEVARDVRVISPNVPLIMLSGDPKLPISAHECVDAVLTKGTDGPGELLWAIRRLLPNADIRLPR